jgi:hypothetical protein
VWWAGEQHGKYVHLVMTLKGEKNKATRVMQKCLRTNSSINITATQFPIRYIHYTTNLNPTSQPRFHYLCFFVVECDGSGDR